MTNQELPLTFANDTNLINQTVEALKQKLDHISANEIDIWNAVHTHKGQYLMNQYTAGLQLLSDQPLYPMRITAETSDKAWNIAVHKYKNRGFNKSELTTMVLYNERKLP